MSKPGYGTDPEEQESQHAACHTTTCTSELPNALSSTRQWQFSFSVVYFLSSGTRTFAFGLKVNGLGWGNHYGLLDRTAKGWYKIL